MLFWPTSPLNAQPIFFLESWGGLWPQRSAARLSRRIHSCNKGFPGSAQYSLPATTRSHPAVCPLWTHRPANAALASLVPNRMMCWLCERKGRCKCLHFFLRMILHPFLPPRPFSCSAPALFYTPPFYFPSLSFFFAFQMMVIYQHCF